MGSFSLIHWVIIAVFVMLLFGGSRFSAMMGDVAKGLKSFKQGMADEDDKPRAPLDPRQLPPQQPYQQPYQQPIDITPHSPVQQAPLAPPAAPPVAPGAAPATPPAAPPSANPAATDPAAPAAPRDDSAL